MAKVCPAGRSKIFVRTKSGEYTGELSEYTPSEWLFLANVVRSRLDTPRSDLFVYPLIRFKMENVVEMAVLDGQDAQHAQRLSLLMDALERNRREVAHGPESRPAKSLKSRAAVGGQ